MPLSAIVGGGLTSFSSSGVGSLVARLTWEQIHRLAIMSHRIAVIGAGPSGLSALKAFRDYGHQMVLFEQESSIGGLWNYQDEGKLYAALPDHEQRINSCYLSLVMNTSKRMSQFSDFPAADSLSTFMRHSEFLHYMQEYAHHFQLLDHIKFNCTVTKLCPIDDASSVDRWEVHYKKPDGTIEMETFDKVVVASGKFPNVLLPEYPRMDEFQGIVIHSAQVRQDVRLFEGKRVLMVGGSNSAVEMIGIALNADVKDLYWSVSASLQDKNRWMFDRFPTASGAWDENVVRHDYFKNPQVYVDKFVSWLQPISQREDEPQLKSPPDRLMITNTREVHKGLLSGRLRKVAPIKSFSQQSAVLLSDNTTIGKIDVVVFCTGFASRFDFLDGLWSLKHQKDAIVYRHMLPAEKQLQGIAFVGLTYALTPLFPVAEMQSRWLADFWASRTYSPDGTLYTDKETACFKADIQKRIDSLAPFEPYNFITDSYDYIDALAKEVGCQPPDTDELLSTDRELALALLHGPLFAAQYRIVGRHAWVGARDYVTKASQEVLGQKKWQDLLAKE